MLNGWEATCCDEHRFHAKNQGECLNRFRVIVV